MSPTHGLRCGHGQISLGALLLGCSSPSGEISQPDPTSASTATEGTSFATGVGGGTTNASAGGAIGTAGTTSASGGVVGDMMSSTTSMMVSTTSLSGSDATSMGGSAGTAATTTGAGASGGGVGGTTPTPSAGCDEPWAPSDLEMEEESWRGPGAQVVRREIDIGGVARRYMVVVPLDYDFSRRYPLVFAFHGLGGDREQLRGYMNIERPAEGNALVIYPEGLVVQGSDTGWDLDSDSDDLAFVDALYEKYTAELCVDEDRVFATGHSYGGCMTNSVGCYRGDRFRAIAPIAGCGPFAFNATCSGQVAAMIIHSPKDTTTDYSSGMQGCNRHFAQNSCDQSPECGCYWVEALDGNSECVQEAQEPYPTGQEIEVSEDDDKPPEFRQYLNCDPGFPVVQVDHWNGRDPRYHNPPSWSAEVIWEFFGSLPDVN